VQLAGALSPSLQAGRNRLLSVFPDPAEQALYPDWDDVTARLLADFRTSAGNDVGDQRFAQLRSGLSRSGDRFRQSPARRRPSKSSSRCARWMSALGSKTCDPAIAH
jgi:transcription regulator MmyB-like protein